MIKTALEFLTEEINTYLKLKNDLPGDRIFLTNVADEQGGWAIKKDTLGLSLINIEEERVFKEQRSAYINELGKTEHMNPELKLNLYVLVSANFTDDDNTNTSQYKEGLKQVSRVMSFFQGKNVFTPENSPQLHTADPNIKKLVVELYSYSFEQQYNFWSVIGAKYLPSVLYRVRMITLQEKNTIGQYPQISSINIQGSSSL